METVVSEKGQVTIPKRLRDRFGIRPGDVLDVTEEGGRLVVRKTTAHDPFDELYGVVALDGGTDAFWSRFVVSRRAVSDHGGRFECPA